MIDLYNGDCLEVMDVLKDIENSKPDISTLD